MPKVTTDNLASEITKALEEWAEDETKVLEEAIKTAAKLGVRALKIDSPRKSGDYAKGWTYRMEGDRVAKSAVIYNAKKPGLAHLLEYGHARKRGGRVKGIVHIKPVEKEIIETLERELTEKL